MADDLLTFDAQDERRLRRAQTRVRAGYRNRHIVFVGFMGAGKSSMAELAASALGRAWHDSDQLIAQRSGRSIVSFFEAGDEGEFRCWERDVIAELLAGPASVLSLGGGAFENEATRALAFEHGFVVNLFIRWRDFQRQLPELRQTRPLLRDRSDGEIHDLFLRRQRNYRAAHMRIRMYDGGLDSAVKHLLTVLSE